MFHLLEVLVKVASHAYAWRVGVEVIGVLRFEILKLAHQMVELLVGYYGSVQHIVIIVMRVKFFTQLVYSFYFSHDVYFCR